MYPKKVHSEKEGQKLLKEGIRLFSQAVKSTLGPCGKTVLVENENVIGGFLSTKDGVTVARSIRFADPVMDMAASMLKQAAERTAKDVGDGTTTSVVLAEAIIDAFEEYYTPDCGMSVVDVTRGIQAICDQIVEQLELMKIPVESKEMLKNVATISTNNDPELGELVANLLHEVEVAVVETHDGSDTHAKIVEGLIIDKGWVWKYFANDGRGKECILENPYILICDREIPDLSVIENAVAPFTRMEDGLLIVSPVSTDALQAICHNYAENRKQGTGKFNVCVTSPSSFGEDSKDKMRDIAEILGTTFFSKDTGDDFQQITGIGMLGRAKKATISEDKTIIEPLDSQVEIIEKKVKELEEAKTDADEFDTNRLSGRVKAICGRYGVIQVGAPTSIEMKEKKDRIDDALCAVVSAKKNGVLPGGGSALMRAFTLIYPKISTAEVLVRIMATTVKAPLVQMLSNAGGNADRINDIVDNTFTTDEIFNIKEDLYESIEDSVVFDAFDSTKNSIINATSVATTILNTGCVVSNIRELEQKK